MPILTRSRPAGVQSPDGLATRAQPPVARVTRRLLAAGGLLLMLLLSFLAPARAALPAEALAALRDGRHVLLMRHADAPGVGDPPGLRLGDCRTQRNLGEAGRAQARAIGDFLRAQGVASARVLSSPWCRCIDTATGLAIGAVETADALGSFFSEPEKGQAQTRQLQALVARELARAGGQPLVLVTHQVNITAYVGESVAVGEMILVRTDAQGRALSHRRLPGPRP